MLKSLELSGFKSFADRTRFDFAAGITGVVGPNGSGKSNVVDAIKWILGDQSPRSLRGKEMIDVIFNGATGRKASPVAEATITFDNSSGFLPVAQQEVQVGRRLWRNGDSEYLINQIPSRLKDVRELFMGTGAGNAAYCIIEQGRVDQILQSNSTSRRGIFEEAAGISLFRTRKSEFLRRMERVNQNLVRLQDIVDEVEARLTSLRSQAIKARKHRELSDELRQWWLGLAADDFRRFERLVFLHSETITTQSDFVQSATENQRDLEAQIQLLDAEIAVHEDLLREAERDRGSCREEVVGFQSTVAHQTARLNEMEAEQSRLRRQQRLLAARVVEAGQELEHQRGVLLECQNVHHELAEKASSCDLALREAQQKRLDARVLRDEARQTLFIRERQSLQIVERLQEMESQLRAAEGGHRSAADRRAEIDLRIHTVTGEYEQRRIVVTEAVAERDALIARQREIQRRGATLRGEVGDSQGRIAELREERSANQARKSLLEDLESRQEGVGIGAREILARAATSDYSPWNAIHGSVAEILETDLDQAALLDVALGTRSQLIVIEHLDPLAEYLASSISQISGRVGFLALETGKVVSLKPDAAHEAISCDPSDESARKYALRDDAAEEFEATIAAEKNSEKWQGAKRRPDLRGQPGVLRRADELVTNVDQPIARRIAARLLEDSWIVEHLDDARRLWSGLGQGCRFITLQGELLDVDGTLIVGAMRQETALVSRRSELKRLKSDLQRIDMRIADEEHQLEQAANALYATDEDYASAVQEAKSAAERAAAVQSELHSFERELARLHAERRTIEDELEAMTLAVTGYREQLLAARQSRVEIDQQLDEIRETIERCDADCVELEESQHALERQLAACRLDLARQEERVRSSQTSCDRIEQDQEQRRLQQAEAERRLDAAIVRRSQISLSILNIGSQLAERQIESERLELRSRSITRQRHQLRERRTDLAKKETEIRQRRREAEELRHKAEISLQELRLQLESLRNRIDEEYQLDLSEVAASNISALKLWDESKAALRRRGTEDESAGSEESMARNQIHAEESSHAVESSLDDELAERMLAYEVPSDEQWDLEIDGEVDLRMPAETEVRFLAVRSQIEEHVQRLRRKLKLMGSVNADSLADLDELEARFENLGSQLADLQEAKAALEEIVARINEESQRLFLETFESIRGNFQLLFRKAFGGGEGDIVLEDRNDVLDCGIDIVARPPGKELKSITLMSGGEKTLTAFALLLAIFKCRPSPYCVLDEVDAALDEANVERLMALVHEFKENTQFLMITHKKPSMTICDVLYGVTMEQAGVSRRLTVRFEDIREDGGFASPGEKSGSHAA